MSDIENTSGEATTETSAASAIITFGAGLISLASKFSFRPRKLKDAEGKEIGEALKVPAAEVTLPVPSIESIVTLLQSTSEELAKQRKLVMDSIYDIIRGQAKSQLEEIIDSFTDAASVRALTQGDLRYNELTLEFISNLEPGRRGATPIAEETFELFYSDYSEVMVQAAGIDPKKVAAQLELLKTPTRVKSRKDLQQVLVTLLNQYATATAKLEDTGPVYERLKGKLEKWLKEEDKVSVDALV